MATIKQDYSSMGIPKSIDRSEPIPLDNTELWNSYTEAKNYAKNGLTSYVGQSLKVVDTEDDEVYLYVIRNENGDLRKIVDEYDLGYYVHESRTINGKALNANITLTPEDLGINIEELMAQYTLSAPVLVTGKNQITANFKKPATFSGYVPCYIKLLIYVDDEYLNTVEKEITADSSASISWGYSEICSGHLDSSKTFTFKAMMCGNEALSSVWSNIVTDKYVITQQISGTWVFNETIDASGLPSGSENTQIPFASDELETDKFSCLVYDGEYLLYNSPNGTVIYDNGWEDESYRTFTVTGSQTINADLYNWIWNNAKPVYTLSGTWLFKDNIETLSDTVGASFTENISFMSNGSLFQSIEHRRNDDDDGCLIYYPSSGSTLTVYYYEDDGGMTLGWLGNEAYKEVTLAEQGVSEQFYNWFTSNADYQSGGDSDSGGGVITPPPSSEGSEDIM